MLTPFRLGLGGVVGAGDQYMSWIALDDVVGAIHHCMMNEALSGPVNGVASHPVTNREYTKTLGSVLSRPTLFPMPAFAVRLAFGEMGEELLLSSTRVEPGQLTASGYAHRFPELRGALQHLLGR
jgi:NAD dependent epimerase/dehydratase family enzyme